MLNRLFSRATASFDPARKWLAVVPSDTVDFVNIPKALWVNAACTLRLMGDDSQVEDFVVAGPGPVPLSPRRVFATGTTGGVAIKGLFD